MARTDPQVNIRIPRELLMHLASEATANNRSTNAEIVSRLAASGETLRDRFAMAALPWAVSVAMEFSTKDASPAPTAAGLAYEMADAMLAEREKGGAA